MNLLFNYLLLPTAVGLDGLFSMKVGNVTELHIVAVIQVFTMIFPLALLSSMY